MRNNFDLQDFNKMCWTLCFKKNISTNHLLISNDDAFKVWSIFNFLSEDRYPLVIVIEEVRHRHSFHSVDTNMPSKHPDFLGEIHKWVNSAGKLAQYLII